jgi:hypothetical protein
MDDWTCRQIIKSLKNKQKTILKMERCHNPSLGLTTKARACKSAGQEGSPGVTSHAPGSAKECEGMNPHTPKGAPTLGVWSPGGLPNLQRAIARAKT